MPRKYQLALREKATLRLSEARRVDLRRMLQMLRSEYEVRRVACEGGAELFRGLLELQLVDQLNLTIAPYIFGGKDAPTLTGRATSFLPASVRCSLSEMRIVGEECFASYQLKYARRREELIDGARSAHLSHLLRIFWPSSRPLIARRNPPLILSLSFLRNPCTPATRSSSRLRAKRSSRRRPISRNGRASCRITAISASSSATRSAASWKWRPCAPVSQFPGPPSLSSIASGWSCVFCI